jgi:hypothetical protein
MFPMTTHVENVVLLELKWLNAGPV